MSMTEKAEKIAGILKNDNSLSYGGFATIWQSKYNDPLPSEGYFYGIKRVALSTPSSDSNRTQKIQECLVAAGSNASYKAFERTWKEKFKDAKVPTSPYFYTVRKQFLTQAKGEKRAVYPSQETPDLYEQLEESLDALVAQAVILKNDALIHQLKNARRIASSEIVRKVLS